MLRGLNEIFQEELPYAWLVSSQQTYFLIICILFNEIIKPFSDMTPKIPFYFICLKLHLPSASQPFLTLSLQHAIS